MSDVIEDACAYASAALVAVADPDKAVGMQGYMKTDMPFYGVQQPQRAPILRRLVADFSPHDRDRYEALVLGLWGLQHREEKYLALGVARAHRQYVLPASLPLYRRLITEGAWWDLVDEVATHLIRALVTSHADDAWPVVDRWIDDPDLWLRRAAIICQVGAREDTDSHRLFRFCQQRAHEQDFFIRKAIGWALRDYARTDPKAVAGFVSAQADALSSLSRREAIKHIGHLVTR